MAKASERWYGTKWDHAERRMYSIYLDKFEGESKEWRRVNGSDNGGEDRNHRGENYISSNIS